MRQIPDFHEAIQRAFDDTETPTNILEIRSIKIEPGTDLNEEHTLIQIWKKVLHLPSTRIPQLKLITQVKPQVAQPGFSEIMTKPEVVDRLFYETFHKQQWQENKTNLNFQEWLSQSGILQRMELQGWHMDFPYLWKHLVQT